MPINDFREEKELKLENEGEEVGKTGGEEEEDGEQERWQNVHCKTWKNARQTSTSNGRRQMNRKQTCAQSFKKPKSNQTRKKGFNKHGFSSSFGYCSQNNKKSQILCYICSYSISFSC